MPPLYRTTRAYACNTESTMSVPDSVRERFERAYRQLRKEGDCRPVYWAAREAGWCAVAQRPRAAAARHLRFAGLSRRHRELWEYHMRQSRSLRSTSHRLP